MFRSDCGRNMQGISSFKVDLQEISEISEKILI